MLTLMHSRTGPAIPTRGGSGVGRGVAIRHHTRWRRPAAAANPPSSSSPPPGDDLAAFHSRLESAVAAAGAAARTIAAWRARRPSLPAYSASVALPAAEAAADARLLARWHEDAWAALAHATLDSGDWDHVLGGSDGHGSGGM